MNKSTAKIIEQLNLAVVKAGIAVANVPAFLLTPSINL